MQEQAGGQAPGAERGGTDVVQLVELTWRQQCSACHGALGRGDGQMGPMVKAPDLTREDWQSRVTDAEIAATIKDGKGKMPKFDVPDPVVQGLVARVRATRGR
jgi:mono/diheme cytochrome c family protein